MKVRALVFAAVLVAVGLGASGAQAAGPLHQYFYDTSSHDNAGYAHNGVYMIRNGVHYDNRTVWETIVVEGQSSWYGPKDDIYGAGANVQACWYYTRPAFVSSTVIFDITYGSTPTILYSTGNKTLSALGYEPSFWPLEQWCHTVTLNGTLYDKFQVRVRVVSVFYDPNNPSANAMKIYKTSYQVL